MKILAIALGALLILALCAVLLRIAFEPKGHTVEQIADIEAGKLQAALGRDFAMVVGIYHGGQVWTKGYGRVSATDASLPNGTTVFQIGSITKVFTASLLQLLTGRHGLSEARTIKDVLGTSVPLDNAVAGLTLGQLATHTAGFPRVPSFLEKDLPSPLSEQAVLKDPYSHVKPDTVFAYLGTAPGKDAGRPGRFGYSNYGMGLLGHLLERATGQPYRALLQQEIIGPLAMRHTTVTPWDTLPEHLAQGHTMEGEPTPPWRFQALEGAGTLLSTADDMLRFARANIEDGPPPHTQLHAQLQAMHAARGSGETGLGWMQPTLVDKVLGNTGIVWHDGGTLGHASYLSVDRQRGQAVVILSANGTPVTMFGAMLTRKLRRLQTSETLSPSP